MTTDTLRDRIADTLMPFFANFSDEEAARTNSGEAAGAVLAALPGPTDRAAILTQAADWLTKKYGVTNRAAGDLRRLAAETQRECWASISGNCLRESQSETACDTEAGECVYGGRPAVEEAYPSHSSWLVELLMADGHWASAFHAHDREAAIDRLHHRRKYAPHRKWRLVELRETYTVEETP